MPTVEIKGLGEKPSFTELIDRFIELQRDLNYYMNNLDTENVERLDAKVIKTGVLDANLVTVRSDLTGTYTQIDGNGITALDQTTSQYIQLNGKSFTSYDSTGDARISIDIVNQAWGFSDPASIKFLISGTMVGAIGTNTLGNFYMGVSQNPTYIFGDQITLEADDGINTVTMRVDALLNQITMYNDVEFRGTVFGLVTDTLGNHDHGITPGREIQTREWNAGTGTYDYYWETFSTDGNHSHTVL